MNLRLAIKHREAKAGLASLTGNARATRKHKRRAEELRLAQKIKRECKAS